MLYFIADCRFGSEAQLSRRKQFDSLEAMDSMLISRWNATVETKDIVVCVGDFSDYSAYKTVRILQQLNGKKHLAPGGHDKFVQDDLLKRERVFTSVSEIINIQETNSKRWFVASHYPMLSWKYRTQGTLHVHGHVLPVPAGTLEADIFPLRDAFCVSADQNDLTPVSAKNLLERSNNHEWTQLTRKYFSIPR